MNTDTDLDQAYEITRRQFPDCWLSVEERIFGEKTPDREFRISVIGADNICFGADGQTPAEAFAKVLKSYNQPKDEEIRKAIAFLKSQGIQVGGGES